MFLWAGFGAFLLVLALCIDTIDLPAFPNEYVVRLMLWRDTTEAFMKIALRSLTNGKFVTMWDTGILRADREEIGIGEEFELIDLDPTPPPPPAIWPPAAGTHPPMPPDINTVVYDEVLERVRWALWNANSSDDESYWMGVIIVHPEHTPGWTDTGYWRTDKIDKGDGVGGGYVWPPK